MTAFLAKTTLGFKGVQVQMIQTKRSNRSSLWVSIGTLLRFPKSFSLSLNVIKLRICFCIFAAMFSLWASAAANFPADVRKFIDRRDGCDHFRGEEPYDEERRQFLNKNMKNLCTGTDKHLTQLKRKYRHKVLIIKKLNEYDEVTEHHGK